MVMPASAKWTNAVPFIAHLRYNVMVELLMLRSREVITEHY